MDDIFFFCAVCGGRLRASCENAGGLQECPSCQCVVPIPGYPARPGHSAGCAELFSTRILSIEIAFRCDACRIKLQIDARWQGMILACPACHAEMKVPSWSGAPPPMSRRQRPSRPVAHLARLTAQEFEFLSSPSNAGNPMAATVAKQKR